MNSEFLMLPHFDPTIFTFGDSNIGAALVWLNVSIRFHFCSLASGSVVPISQTVAGQVDQVDTLLLMAFMGVFLGGRIGDVFFYNFDHFVQDPLYLFRVWEGGMSFHGGLIGGS